MGDQADPRQASDPARRQAVDAAGGDVCALFPARQQPPHPIAHRQAVAGGERHRRSGRLGL
ncbi:hypothetical protein AI27_05340 [Sphingomonas sp. BHC-A]|nr:hypothetical protein AI27_05340 [Sphingomonas sp. BHC-A]